MCKLRPPRSAHKQTAKMAASTEEELSRFSVISDEDLEAFIGSTDSENTSKQIKYGLSIFKEYCSLVDVNFEGLATTNV